MPASVPLQLTLPGPLGAAYRRRPAPQALPQRFWGKVDTSNGRDACWGWLGALSAKRPPHVRGVIWHVAPDGTERLLYAHRVALWLASDPYALDFTGYTRPDLSGWQACHRCPGPAGPWALCCNPRHLYFGTRADNDRDRRMAAAAAVVRACFGDAAAS